MLIPLLMLSLSCTTLPNIHLNKAPIPDAPQLHPKVVKAQDHQWLCFRDDEARALYKWILKVIGAKKQDEKTIDKANELLGGK
jgi:hypothetical protein